MEMYDLCDLARGISSRRSVGASIRVRTISGDQEKSVCL